MKMQSRTHLVPACISCVAQSEFFLGLRAGVCQPGHTRLSCDRHPAGGWFCCCVPTLPAPSSQASGWDPPSLSITGVWPGSATGLWVPSPLLNQRGTLFKTIVAPLRWGQRTCCLPSRWCRRAAIATSREFSDMQICFADHHLFLPCAT